MQGKHTMPPRKRFREDHGAAQSSRVCIIKLEPAVSDNPSSSKQVTTNSESAEDNALSRFSHPSPSHILPDEISQNSSSCDFSSEDIELEYDSDDASQSDLSVDEESNSEYSQHISQLHNNDAYRNFIISMNQNGGERRGQDTVHDNDAYRNFITAVNQNRGERNGQDAVYNDDAYRNFIIAMNQNRVERSVKVAVDSNGKKLRGWCASRDKLTFQMKWLNEFPFIEYDAKNNLMFCRACRKYVNDWRKTSPFVIGNRNFRESMLKYHARSSMHIECQELADTVSSEGDDKDLYKEQLSHVFKSVYFIFKNKMPYTHYPQLCESQKREGTDFSVYTSHLKVVPLFGKFICMAFEREVAKKLENVSEFALVIDASFRRNIESHDLVYLKYLDNLMVKTVFLGVIDSSAKLHDSIYSLLSDLFRKYGVTSWVDKIVYLMTDKSDNHMWLEGLLQLIKENDPQNFFCSVKYLSHKIKYCASIVQNHKISSTFDALLWSMYCYYEKIDKSKKNLAHMNKELDSIVESYGNLPKNPYTTSYYEALIAIVKDYGNFVQLLESEQLMLHYDAKVRKAGARILSVITRSGFLCKLALFIDIFSCLNDFATKLSSEDILPYDVDILLEEVCADIEKAAAGQGPHCLEIGDELSTTPCSFRGVEIVEDGVINHVLPDIKSFSRDVISYLKSLVDDDSLLEKSFIFNISMWPEDEEIDKFGNVEFLEIFKKFFKNIKLFQIDKALDEWKEFKTKVIFLFPAEVRQNSKSVILKMVSEYEKEFPYVIPLLKRILLLNFESSEIKRGYHEMCLNKSFSRSMLSLQSLQIAMIISMYGPSLSEFDFSLPLDLFLNSRHRKFRKKIIDKKLLFL